MRTTASNAQLQTDFKFVFLVRPQNQNLLCAESDAVYPFKNHCLHQLFAHESMFIANNQEGIIVWDEIKLVLTNSNGLAFWCYIIWLMSGSEVNLVTWVEWLRRQSYRRNFGFKKAKLRHFNCDLISELLFFQLKKCTIEHLKKNLVFLNDIYNFFL